MHHHRIQQYSHEKDFTRPGPTSRSIFGTKDHLRAEDGHLLIDGVDVVEIVEDFGNPFT
ncbi:MAG TPA: hypothetical protein PLX30_01350 [Methanothrix sp.]|nr:hypothetical protein [Methanothrix sp.]